MRRKRAQPRVEVERAGASAGPQVGPGMVVSVAYRVFDAEGEPAEDEAPPPLEVIHGCGQLLPAIEHALDGLHAGDRCSLVLAPDAAYGAWDPEAVLEVDRDELPADAAPGDCFEAEREDGGLVVLKVLDVTPDAVILDANHPLAGQEVRFALEVLAVRPATTEEVELAMERIDAQSPAEGPLAGELVPADRLVSRARRG